MGFPSFWTRGKTLSWVFQVFGREEKLCHEFSKFLNARKNFVMGFPSFWTRGKTLSWVFQVFEREEKLCRGFSKFLDTRKSFVTAFQSIESGRVLGGLAQDLFNRLDHIVRIERLDDIGVKTCRDC